MYYLGYHPHLFCGLPITFIIYCRKIHREQRFWRGTNESKQTEIRGLPTPKPSRTAGSVDVQDPAKDVPKNILSQSYPGAVSDFYGLPTNPVCIYRTGDKWPVPQGPQAQRIPREARPVFNHPLQDA